MKTIHCKTCHSENVVADAWAAWDGKEWGLLHEVFAHRYCEDCEGDCSVYEKEYRSVESFTVVINGRSSTIDKLRIYIDEQPTDEFIYRIEGAFVNKEAFDIAKENMLQFLTS